MVAQRFQRRISTSFPFIQPAEGPAGSQHSRLARVGSLLRGKGRMGPDSLRGRSTPASAIRPGSAGADGLGRGRGRSNRLAYVGARRARSVQAAWRRGSIGGYGDCGGRILCDPIVCDLLAGPVDPLRAHRPAAVVGHCLDRFDDAVLCGPLAQTDSRLSLLAGRGVHAGNDGRVACSRLSGFRPQSAGGSSVARAIQTGAGRLGGGGLRAGGDRFNFLR